MNVEARAEMKRFENLRAAFALAGHCLTRSDSNDGPPRFYVSRWGLVREIATVDEAERFFSQIGGKGSSRER